MPSLQKKYRPMRRQEYPDAFEELNRLRPWLEKQALQPAPGHLEVPADLIVQCEQLMQRRDLQPHPPFCVTSAREKLSNQIERSDASLQQEPLDMLEHARHIAQHFCPVYGAPVLGGDENTPEGTRCSAQHHVEDPFDEDLHQFMLESMDAMSVGDEDGYPALEKSERERRTEHCDASSRAKTDLPDSSESAQDNSGTSRKDRHAPVITFLDAFKVNQLINDKHDKHLKTVIQRIRDAGFDQRTLGMLPDDWNAMIEEFAQIFPNFSELTKILRDQFALQARGDGRVAWMPILLVGSAGVGKTEASHWLAKRLALPFKVLDMASAHTGSPLSGSEAFWSNTQPGLLFELLAYQPTANPIVLLDELDKAASGKHQYDPLSPLYTLLEPASAQTLTDLSTSSFAINARHVNWIATANSVDNIPGPLLSRLTVLHIHTPTPEQVAQIAQNMYARIRAEFQWGSTFLPYLDEDVVSMLKHLPPRGIGNALQRALGRAAHDKRDHIQPKDINSGKHDNSGKRSIGFTADLNVQM